MAGIQALMGMQRPLTWGVSASHLDRRADIAGPRLGDMGLQQQPLDLTPAAFLLPLDGMQRHLAALLTH
jgi:hypothetical protein